MSGKKQVRLSLWAENLMNSEGTSCLGYGRGISDPYAKVKYQKDDSYAGETEKLLNTLHPQWSTPIFLEYEIGTVLNLIVEIFGSNKKTGDLLLGVGEIDVGYILSNSEIKIHKEDLSEGQLYAYAEIVDESKHLENLNLKIRGLDIKNVDEGYLRLGKSDPFYEVAKKVSEPSKGSVEWVVVYRSAHIKEHSNPVWEKSTIDLDALCNGNLSSPIKITCLDFSETKETVFIGYVETSVEELIDKYENTHGNADRKYALPLRDKENNDSITTGLLVVIEATIEP
mmetsp:Transcript_7633/g.7819  ORF Transcript_7633/g.7819 Transcript_7633/m.7819 type:complete len:284 (-) Transcript_7633:277-1128(-)